MVNDVGLDEGREVIVLGEERTGPLVAEASVPVEVDVDEWFLPAAIEGQPVHAPPDAQAVPEAEQRSRLVGQLTQGDEPALFTVL